jgi:ABC-type dipeptide/oligopeptide/nickel transport system permease subunit
MTMDAIQHQTSAGGAEPVAQRGASLWADARRRLARDRWAMLCLGIIAFYVLLALGGAMYEALAAPEGGIPTFEETINFDQSYRPPSLDSLRNLLGTDWAGRSVLLKTVLGAKVSLTVGLMSNLIAVPLGLMLGAAAGYFGRRTDAVIVWLYSTMASVPGIVLLIAMKYAFKNVTFLGLNLGGIHGLYIALGVTAWVGTCRYVRAEVMKVRELEYVLAARAVGRGNVMILLRHVLPNVLHLGIISFSLGVVGAITAEVTLSYLGLGVEVGMPSWGTMIDGARMELHAGRWWELASAVGAMFLLVLALNIFGDRLRDALDPRLKNV